jgi:hypothetical protein
VKFKSQVFTQASGSVGGLTFAHNKGGLYTRARSIPTDPGSPDQTQRRGVFSGLASDWVLVLSPAQRQSWADYAANVPLIDSLGEARTIPPLAQYVRSNTVRLLAGLTKLNGAPALYTLGSLAPISVTASSGTQLLTISFDETDDWPTTNNSALVILASRSQNLSTNFFKGPYRFAGAILGDALSPPTSPQTLTAPFFLNTSSRVFVQGRVTEGDGRLSYAQRAFSPVGV